MARKKEYLFNIIPRWLLYSGLPKKLNEKYGPEAWGIYRTLIELDCRFNPDHPGTFDQSFEELAEQTGLSRRTISRYVKLFERGFLLVVKRGKFKGSKSTFLLAPNLPTPKHPKDIHALNGGLLNRKGKAPNLRYAESVSGRHPLEKERVTGRHPLEKGKGDKYDTKGRQVERERVTGFPNNKKKEEEKRRQQNQGKKPADVVKVFLKKSLKTTLKTWGLSDTKINELLKTLIKNGHTDINEEINLWIEHINRIKAKNPAGYLIAVVKENATPPGIESPKFGELKEEEKEKLFREAKIELGRLSSKERILNWLKKLPENYHQKLKRHLDYIYPKGHSYQEAKEEWVQPIDGESEKYWSVYE